MESYKKYKDDFILFLESGFIAVNQADEESAVKLFRAAELLNPESSFPQIGLGYLHFHKLELTQACEVFEGVLKKDPKNEMARTLLGMSLSLTPDKCEDGEKILKEMSKSTSDETVKNASQTSLDFVNRFVKKDEHPAAVKKKK